MRFVAAACALSMAAVVAAQSGGICTHVEGVVADTAVRVINVHKVDQNNSYVYTDTIPFANGRFSYDIRTEGLAVYDVSAYNKDWIGRFARFFADGDTVIPLVSSQDHKRLLDGDRGPNTGGMGAYSPAPVVTDALMREIDETILRRFLRGRRGRRCRA